MSATAQQSEFIKDLILQKFRSFSEFKKWLATTGIVRTNGQIFKESLNLPHIANRISTTQASSIITQLQTLEDVTYLQAYSEEQRNEVAEIMAEIKQEVASWTFQEQ